MLPAWYGGRATVAAVVEGEVSGGVPASVLKRHQIGTFLLDEDADSDQGGGVTD